MYIDLNYILTRNRERFLIELTDDSKSPDGTINTARINSFIGDADSVINTYLGMQYATPIVAPAAAVAYLQTLEHDLVIFYLWNVIQGQDIPPDIAFRYKVAIDSLQSLSNGSLKLPGVLGPAIATSAIGTNKVAADKVFDANTIFSYLGPKKIYRGTIL